MLLIEDLHVRYGHIEAVRGLSLSAAPGEIIALIGPNGAGKSSTTMAVIGLIRTHSGCVKIDGTTVTGLPPERIARLGVGFVPEWRGVFGTLTVRENLRLGAEALGRRGSIVEESVGAALEHFPALRAKLSRRAAVLSGGERQQLALARALVARPRLLVLDEPSLGLAPVLVDQLFAALDQLRAEGITILLAEQNVMRATKLADHVYALKQGVGERLDEPRMLLHDAQFRHEYLGIAER